MAIKWKLKKYIEDEHSITSAKELKILIENKTGICISLQNICNYLTKKPSMIRLETMEIFCTALDCKLSMFLELTPSRKNKKLNCKLSYRNTPHAKRGTNNFPNPEDYNS
jgi:DNA-binding Xre family transcriptional regulator